jgi:hypothetical protein
MTLIAIAPDWTFLACTAGFAHGYSQQSRSHSTSEAYD